MAKETFEQKKRRIVSSGNVARAKKAQSSGSRLSKGDVRALASQPKPAPTVKDIAPTASKSQQARAAELINAPTPTQTIPVAQEPAKQLGDLIGLSKDPFQAQQQLEALGLGTKEQPITQFSILDKTKEFAQKYIPAFNQEPIDWSAPGAGEEAFQRTKWSAVSMGVGGLYASTFKVTAGGAVANPKNAGLIANIAKTILDPRTILTVGMAGLSTYILGLWGGAEAPEPLNIPEKMVVDQALATGDWTLFDELNKARDDIFSEGTEQSLLDAIPIFGDAIKRIKQKWDANRAGAKVIQQWGENEKIRQQNGEDDRAYWERVKQQEKQDFIDNTNYYNEQRRQMIEWEREAEVAARNEDADFWREQAEKTRKAEAEDRKAVADFWFAYRKKVQQLSDANRPSQLNFGLL